MTWLAVSTGLPIAASRPAITSYVGRLVQLMKIASAAALSTLRTSSTVVSYGTAQICAISPSPAVATTSIPAWARKAVRPAVRSFVYGVTVAIRLIPSRRSASSRAPLVVTAAGAPAPTMASTSASSPSSPPTKLPKVQA